MPKILKEKKHTILSTSCLLDLKRFESKHLNCRKENTNDERMRVIPPLCMHIYF